MSTRKDFLTAIAAASAAPTARPVPTPVRVQNKKPNAMCVVKPVDPAKLTFEFDRSRFNAILTKDAKHKQCFGITNVNDGAGLDAMMNSIVAYDDFLNEGSGALHAAGVLYHGASVAFAMSDEIWNTYLIPMLPHAPAEIRQDIGTVKAGAGNPYKERFGGLVARGASFFVCHNAIAGFSEFAAGALRTTTAKVHDAILGGMLPGALVVPAGVMAINACQEAKFTYISAS